jgi:hypothetical protein
VTRSSSDRPRSHYEAPVAQSALEQFQSAAEAVLKVKNEKAPSSPRRARSASSTSSRLSF